MKEPRLIKGKSVARYIAEGIFISAFFLILALWGIRHSLKIRSSYLEKANSLEPLIIVYIVHYGFLICSIAIILLTLFLIKETIFKALDCCDSFVSKKIDRLFLTPLIITIFSIVPLTYAGHFLTKHQITQKGYYYCGSLRHKDRLRGAFVLEEEDCYDPKLQRIMLQHGKNNQLILEEAHSYLLEQKTTQTTRE